MAAFDEQEYTKSFDLKIWKRLTPLLAPYKMAFCGHVCIQRPVCPGGRGPAPVSAVCHWKFH